LHLMCTKPILSFAKLLDAKTIRLGRPLRILSHLNIKNAANEVLVTVIEKK